MRGDTPLIDRADLIEGRDRIRGGVGLEAERVVDRHREHRRFGEQPAADRRRPLDLADVVELRGLHHVGDRIVDARGQPVVGTMAAPLDAAIVVERELVVPVRLQRQAHGVVADVLIVDRLRPGRRERVAQEVVGAPATVGREEPEAIALDRSAEREVGVVDALHPVLDLETEIDEILRQVVRLHVSVRAGDEDGAAIGVAAVARDHVDLHAAHRRLRRQRAGLVADFFHQPVVEVEAGLVAAEADVLNLDAVDHEHVVVVRRAVHLERRLLHDLRAADIGRRGGDAGDELSDRERILAGRDRVEPLAAHHRLRYRSAHVDERRLARHRHRLLQRADRHLGVDRRGERGGQADLVALHRCGIR